VDNALNLCKALGVSSAHILFLPETMTGA
jgi:hypothetical protein